VRILVDESLPPNLAVRLTDEGHAARHIRQLGLTGFPDAAVFQAAQAENAVLISRDVGFADTTAYKLGSHRGIVVVRMPNRIRISHLIDVVTARMRTLADEDVTGNVVIIEPDRVRIRRKPA